MKHSTQETICNECGEMKPPGDYYASSRKKCKDCVKARVQANKGIKKHLGRGFPAPEGWRLCPDCRFILPLGEFHKGAGRCKDCAIAAARKDYADNREQRRQRGKKYYAANKERLITQQADYVQRNKPRYSLIKRAYKARQRTGDNQPFTRLHIEAQYEKQRGLCYWCGTALNGTFELDHAVPIAKGGNNSPGNVVCACPRCNKHKRDLLPEEFLAGLS